MTTTKLEVGNVNWRESHGKTYTQTHTHHTHICTHAWGKNNKRGFYISPQTVMWMNIIISLATNRLNIKEITMLTYTHLYTHTHTHKVSPSNQHIMSCGVYLSSPLVSYYLPPPSTPISCTQASQKVLKKAKKSHAVFLCRDQRV